MRGHPGPNLRDEAKEWAERMGYHWAENTDLSVPFDGFLYRDAMMIAVTMKKIRHGLDTDCIIEEKFPDDIADLRSLPVPPYVFRELWVRTQNERAYRRFCIRPDMTAEIQEVTRDNYRNTHYREAYWKKAPYRIDISLQRVGGKKAEFRKACEKYLSVFSDDTIPAVNPQGPDAEKAIVCGQDQIPGISRHSSRPVKCLSPLRILRP